MAVINTIENVRFAAGNTSEKNKGGTQGTARPLSEKINELQTRLSAPQRSLARIHIIRASDYGAVVIVQFDRLSAPLVWVHTDRSIKDTAFDIAKLYISTVFIDRTQRIISHQLHGSLLSLTGHSPTACSAVGYLVGRHQGFRPSEAWTTRTRCLGSSVRQRTWNSSHFEQRLHPSSSLQLGDWTITPQRLPIWAPDYQLLAAHSVENRKCLIVSNEPLAGDGCDLRFTLKNGKALLHWKNETIKKISLSQTADVFEFSIDGNRPTSVFHFPL